MSNRVTSTTTPMAQGMPVQNLPHDRIAKRAYEKWLKGGCKHGQDKQNWLEAETEIRNELTGTAARPGTPVTATQRR